MIPPIASRFVAGESPAEALEHARDLNDRNVKAILNLLGEHYHERAPADEDAEAYLRLVADIESAAAEACISVKPSQVGLDVGTEVFHENVERIADYAADRDVFVWIDMEDHDTTDATLDIFEKLARKHEGGVGVCVQANLKRTDDDLERLADLPGKVRLVKGAYDPPAEVAYEEKSAVNAAYERQLEYMFEQFDGGIAVGSHDPRMIRLAEELHEEYGTDFEIQMLMGVREDAQTDLAEEYEVWQYVPYGDKWLSYFYRRVMERKENLLFAARAVLGR
ncbi:proline dehydrogenase family protein [Halorussus gelatinilyticus]|uniref:proline dehydrogenase n=1 Tax=Halorussus gelatinilyticus TaxID=2937524 RepID=A0A8U0IL67_9EURY|nr:proline dehydrogenase family protein [Halorussus gelatinilyticus]UPW01873.1 proline dehydrogenase family protein [Halorussus gelatinilyticus]